MSLAAFVVVWVAAWAVAWWAWGPRTRVVTYDPPKVQRLGSNEWLVHVDEQYVPSRRHVAPYFATAVAWLFELVRWVASGCVVVALAGCCAPRRCAPPPVDPCGHIGPGLTYRGIGVDGRPACQACGAGKCG